MTTWPKLMSAK